MLAGGLGHQLLEPQAEPGQRLGDDERELVAPGARERAEGGPEPHARRRQRRGLLRGVAAQAVCHAPAAPSSSARTSTPISAAGTMPNGDSAL